MLHLVAVRVKFFGIDIAADSKIVSSETDANSRIPELKFFTGERKNIFSPRIQRPSVPPLRGATMLRRCCLVNYVAKSKNIFIFMPNFFYKNILLIHTIHVNTLSRLPSDHPH